MFHFEHLSFKLGAERCPARECYGYRLMAETFLPGSHRQALMCESTVSGS
jgi:hypothetical protein